MKAAFNCFISVTIVCSTLFFFLKEVDPSGYPLITVSWQLQTFFPSFCAHFIRQQWKFSLKVVNVLYTSFTKGGESG